MRGHSERLQGWSLAPHLFADEKLRSPSEAFDWQSKGRGWAKTHEKPWMIKGRSGIRRFRRLFAPLFGGKKAAVGVR